jgi:bifunctional non-homologous end joining protein LigD
MPLDEYRKKRDFTRTPEPSGDTPPSRTGGRRRFFCVQKHLATNLHYDFRLEHEGVLLSWAVPKGPSLDPATKRLAMQTEDHPLDYGEFEGVIPDGYGAGVVMLWDRGTWEPEVEDVDAALKKGDLKLTLDGYKLKGSWALVRTRGYGSRGDGKTSWLLIKHKDAWSGQLDIAEFAPLSVKSGADFAEILAAEAPAFWTSNPEAAHEQSTIESLRKIVEKVQKLGPSRARPATPGSVSPAEDDAPDGGSTRGRSRTKTRSRK